eukprot:TRINITY_DN6125_c0_g1_i1.p1 TRINITY_DN6125_c0_g1~~TRINITY_DN6125_c0_g1_i1.p1  ORF type:complete len:364 (+),score=36.90 TRINITY_DN6125_c0_g1_i1:188-1279(+)
MGTENTFAHKSRIPDSLFRTKLVQEVHRKLQKAVKDASAQRGELLRQLFTDVALNVDRRAQELLLSPRDGNLSSEQVESGHERPLCFYEVLADHYAGVPEDANAILPLFVSLWSQSFTSQIFSLLLYKWLFNCPAEHEEELVRYSRAFVDGASKVFWIDLVSNVHRFSSLYKYVTDEVVLNPTRMIKVPHQARTELMNVVSRFFFFYAPAERLSVLLGSLPVLGPYPFASSAADVFVGELTNQLLKIKVEPVLLRYLDSTKVLKGVELRLTTSVRMQSALYSLTSPGGPLYPTRAVRHEAWKTLDTLFPVGRNFRHLISVAFRLLHPWYWPVSFWNFMIVKIHDMWRWLFPQRNHHVRIQHQA